MVRWKPLLNAAKVPLIRGVVGFIAGFVVAEFAFLFTGLSHGHWDLNVPDLEQEYLALRLAFYIACGAAGVAMLAGGLRVSRFWFLFVVAFGVICVVPFWPNPKGGGLAPFGITYVNFGYRPEFAVQLAVHVALAACIAVLIQGVLALVRRSKDKPQIPG